MVAIGDSDPWSTDLQQANADVAAHGDMVTQKQNDHDKYYNEVLPNFRAICATHSVEFALMMFMTTIVASIDPQNGANMCGMSEDSYGVVGKSSAVMADIVKLSDDLTDYTNGSVTKGIDDIAKSLNDLLNFLNEPNVQGCFDSDALSTTISQLTGMRNEIYVGDTTDPSYTQYNPGESDSTVYFDTNPKIPGPPVAGSKLKSIDDMQKYMGEKGDIDSATEAAKGFTESESVMTSAGQSINASLNQQIGQETGFEKDIEAMLSSLVKSWIDYVNAILSATSHGFQ